MKKGFILFTILFGALFSSLAFAGEGVNIVINGEAVEAKGIIVESSTLVPVRGVFEKLGFDVNYEESSKTAVLSDGGYTVTITDGKDVIFVNDKEIAVLPAAQIYDGHFLLPLRAIAEAVGATVDWDAESRTAYIETGSGLAYKEYTNDEENPEKLVYGDNANFAAKLNTLMPKYQNYVFSPISVKYCLALAANGADDGTKAEIINALGISDLDEFNDSVKETLDDLSITSDEVLDIDGIVEERYGVSLNIANSIWLNKDYINGGDFSEEYKALVADKYYAEAKAVDNSKAVEEINNWCAEKTNDKISQIISDSDFLACLINAVYFNGKWAYEFSESNTFKEVFTDRNGAEKEIDFMHQTEEFNYYADSNIKIISLPYSGSGVSMYFALSDEEDLDFQKYIDKMDYKKVEVSIPKFKIEYEESLKAVLKELGITKAFDEDNSAYHFKLMFNDTVNENMSVYIDSVIHKAYIDVNEKGTEAAAITALTMAGTSLEPEIQDIYEFKADRPFTYFIRDNRSGEILFMGEYAFAE